MKKEIRKLLDLVQEHPDLPIIAMVERETVSDEYGYSVASFGDAYIEAYAIYNEQYYDDRYVFMEDYLDNNEELLERFNYNPFLQNNEKNERNWVRLDKYLNDICDKYFKKAIVVYIHPYEESEE